MDQLAAPCCTCSSVHAALCTGAVCSLPHGAKEPGLARCREVLHTSGLPEHQMKVLPLSKCPDACNKRGHCAQHPSRAPECFCHRGFFVSRGFSLASQHLPSASRPH